jgi:hypothetical protein
MEVRRNERKRLIYHLRVFDADSGKLLGHLVNITTSGMMLIGESPIPVDTAFSLRMDLPRNVMADASLKFSAESKWCRREAGGEFFSVGFRVSRISPEGLAVVQQLAKDFYQEEYEEEPTADMNPSL